MAIVLDQMIYWSERKNDADKFLQEEMDRIKKYASNESELQNLNIDHLKSHGWIYKKAEDLSEETMINVKPKTMREYLTILVQKGWLDERRNPLIKMDRTLQYRVNLLKIQLDLQAIGYALEGYALAKVEKVNSNLPQENTKEQKENWKGENVNTKGENVAPKGENVTAIPELTTEPTPEITNKASSFSENDTAENEMAVSVEKTSDNAFAFFEKNGFGMVSGYMGDKIGSWCDDLSDELVVEAMKIAVERGARNWSYVEKILQDWLGRKVKSVNEAHAIMAAFQEQKARQRHQPRGRPIRQEKVPEWFDKSGTNQAPQEDQEAVEARKKEVEELLSAFKGGA
ncbi:DnaD domain-containing protein [Bacillus sp. B-jedd]|uniref:DnaD domain-containing protein n=1 Tax=Bacillus sp. B-jedd TaxID=1476857 RepID=UPI0018CD35E6|nr:DnaD domain protein [Bacillus sp. B-jedd]